MLQQVNSHSEVRKAPFVAKGHDRQLEQLQRSGQAIVIQPISGEEITGKIVRRDRYTVTLATGGVNRRLVFKHAIESIGYIDSQLEG